MNRIINGIKYESTDQFLGVIALPADFIMHLPLDGQSPASFMKNKAQALMKDIGVIPKDARFGELENPGSKELEEGWVEFRSSSRVEDMFRIGLSSLERNVARVCFYKVTYTPRLTREQKKQRN